MANYENKLSEFFKFTRKKEDELAAKKKAQETGYQPPAPPRFEPQPRPIDVSAPAPEPAPVMHTVAERREMVSDVAVAERTESETGTARPVASQASRAPALFTDSEVEQVPDFFSFLSSKEERQETDLMEEPPFEVPKDQGSLNLGEGTGVPRPIQIAPPVPPAPVVAQPISTPVAMPREPVAQPEVRVQAPVVTEPPVEVPKPDPVAVVQPEPTPVAVESAEQHAATAEEKWERLPQHLRILFEGEAEEVAQRSYKTFKESRTGLIQRLLDPTISLEDAARILNVCPTTVRRYTNRGVLKHYRTAGNQRRFRLSDVLAFMESKQ